MDLIEILEAGKKDHSIVWIQAKESVMDFNDTLNRVNIALHYATVVMDAGLGVANPKAAVVIGGSYA